MIDKMSSFIEVVNGSGFSPPSKRIRNEASETSVYLLSLVQFYEFLIAGTFAGDYKV